MGVSRTAVVVLLVAVAGCSACGPARSTTATGSAASSPSSVVTGRPFPAPGKGPLPNEQVGALQREVERWVSTGLLPGVTAAVVTPAGTWAGAAGVDGAGARLRAESGMALASITKTFTAAEVMLLAEQGKLDLDAPASRYVPRPQVANGVTVRQLLAQRASVPDPGEGPYDDVLIHPDRGWTADQFLAPVPKATQKPNTRFYYDNTNYVLLGLVVEKASGLPVAAAVTQDLWRPLRLGRLAWQDQQRLAPPLARPGADPLLPKGIPATPYLPFRSLGSAFGAAGGVAGDAAAVATWGYALYGAQILREGSVEQMTDFADGDGYGLGTRDFTAGGYTRWNIDAVGHDGVTVGYRSVMAVFESQRVSVAILTPSTTETGPFVQYLVKAAKLLGT
jgi:CubicO group peptidase (beta-lactamase class C family)